MAEKGTSRQSVRVSPRHRLKTPCDATMSCSPFIVSRKWPAAVAVWFAACILVRNISIGLTAIAAKTRAVAPATKGR